MLYSYIKSHSQILCLNSDRWNYYNQILTYKNAPLLSHWCTPFGVHLYIAVNIWIVGPRIKNISFGVCHSIIQFCQLIVFLCTFFEVFSHLKLRCMFCFFIGRARWYHIWQSISLFDVYKEKERQREVGWNRELKLMCEHFSHPLPPLVAFK